MSKKFVITAISVALILCAVIIIFPDNRDTENTAGNAVTDASDEAHRTAYFESHGWEVEEISVKSVTIPTDFSEAYEEYAVMQDKQGLPLREYAGREASVYTYDVMNYSPDNRKMHAELLVCDDTAIASIVYGNGGKLPVS
ncbi:MAG: DUF4830 domain-containing protein [Ruminococcus flavefaciens]|nr:DUF4830 domain-containing protein [Ruminococcus flavefaciens]MCM1228619.1 DUF4830 domain-containing protein [Ruminococcus flavefaciens]